MMSSIRALVLATVLALGAAPVAAGASPQDPYATCRAPGLTVPVSQCEALVDLRLSAVGPWASDSYVTMTHWLEGDDPCAWPGLGCSAGRVISLSVHGSSTPVVPASIGDLTDLVQLSMSEHDIEVLPVEIGQLTRLDHLALDGNQLEGLPGSMAALTRLRLLRLDDNPLGTLPAAVGDLPALRVLEARHASLTELPATVVRALGTVVRVDLSFNQLTSIPATFGRLPRLQELTLNSNRLTSLPGSLGDAPRLQRLQVPQNQLRTLPGGLARSSTLQRLNASGNPLGWLPRALPSSLTYLQLDNTDLTRLGDGLPAATPALRELSLDGSALDRLPSDLSGWGSLTNLSVAHNQLRWVPRSAGTLRALGAIDVTGNRLTGPQDAWITGLPAGTAVALADGPGGNDCLTLRDATWSARLDAADPGWDECVGGADRPT